MGAQYIAQALLSNSSLQTLDLHGMRQPTLYIKSLNKVTKVFGHSQVCFFTIDFTFKVIE